MHNMSLHIITFTELTYWSGNVNSRDRNMFRLFRFCFDLFRFWTSHKSLKTKVCFDCFDCFDYFRHRYVSKKMCVLKNL